MKHLRTLLLVLLALALTVTAILTWGSIGSMVMVFGLIMMGASLLYQRFLDRDDPDVYE